MKPQVLLLETNPTIRKYLAPVIEARGYQCCPVSSLPAALEAARHQRCDLVIVDLDLPDAGPPGIAARLRGELPGARLVALDSAAPSRAHTSFDRVIPKPFFVEPLLAALSDLLNGSEDATAPEG